MISLIMQYGTSLVILDTQETENKNKNFVILLAASDKHYYCNAQYYQVNKFPESCQIVPEKSLRSITY